MVNQVASEQPRDADNGPHPFVVGIQKRYSGLPPEHRRIADFVLSHEDEVVFFHGQARDGHVGHRPGRHPSRARDVSSEPAIAIQVYGANFTNVGGRHRYEPDGMLVPLRSIYDRVTGAHA